MIDKNADRGKTRAQSAFCGQRTGGRSCSACIGGADARMQAQRRAARSFARTLRAVLLAVFAASAMPMALAGAPSAGNEEADNAVDFDNGKGPGRWAQPGVDLEIRLAAGAVVPASSDGIRVSLDSDKGSIDAELQRDVLRDREGRALLRGSVTITHRAPDRLIVIRIPGQPDRVCPSGLAPDPPTTTVAGNWRDCTMVFDAGAAAARSPRAIEATQFRYTVWRPPVWRDAIR